MIVGVISDTHVPDRAARLAPRALEIFQQAGVAAILHAGDISAAPALAALEQIAPVYAVCGNRDGRILPRLPERRVVTLGGVRIGLAHGHGSLWDYVAEKPYILLHGLQPERYIQRVLGWFPDVDVVVFGHIHLQVNQRVDGRLVFNPGTACGRGYGDVVPGVGLLHITPGEAVRGEIVLL